MNDYITNNSEDMKTVVETYLIEETVELIYDNEKLDKWNGLVADLGLDGQRKIVKKDKSPIPFMSMNGVCVSVFEVLCPSKVKVEHYDLTPIPVDILSLISLSRKEGYFHEIQIWYDEKQKDPCCVGYIYTDWYYQDANGKTIESNLTKESAEAKANEVGGKSGYYNWRNKKYLIGRWADVKQSFKELQQRAKDRYMLQEKTQHLKEIKEAQRKLEDLELAATEKFGI